MMKIFWISLSLTVSAMALATVPDPVYECKSGFLGRGAKAEIDQDPNTGNYILYFGGKEYWLARKWISDDTCPAKSLGYTGSAQDGSVAQFYGDLHAVRKSAGKAVQLSFAVYPKGKKERFITFKCVNVEDAGPSQNN